MKTLTVVGALAAAIALAACGRQDEGTTAQHTDTGTEQRAGDSSNATVDSSRDAAGTPAVDPVAGTTVNRPGDAAHGGTYGSDASGTSSAGGHDAVVTGAGQAEQRVERAGERTEQALERGGERAADATARGVDAAGEAAHRSGEAIENASERAGEATSRGMDAAGGAISDAAITASVKAQLARDEELSALGINVDTDSGRVTLRGTAPSEAAVQRATQLVEHVHGVKGVNNSLRVQSR